MQPDFQLASEIVTAFAGFVAGIGITLNGIALRRALRDAEGRVPHAMDAPAASPLSTGPSRRTASPSPTAAPLAA